MNLTTQLAKHLRDVHFGGNWTTTSLKATLTDVTWQQATTKVHSFNTIAALTYHTSYFVAALLDVLQGKPLTAKDAYSFDHAPITCAEDWQKLLDKAWADAEEAARLIELLPDSRLAEDFVDAKYGTWYRNIQGIIEHMHYHLGQVVIIKKLLAQTNIM